MTGTCGALAALLTVAACSGTSQSPKSVSAADASPTTSSTAKSGSSAPASAQQVDPAIAAPPPSQTGGFDGSAAYDFTAKLVSFGPRPPASDAIHKTQNYIIGELKSFGCDVDTDDFHASTPVGELAMKNIVAKVPGEGPGVILLLTHYDTLKINNFVGADDGGSSTGLMLEMAKVMCEGRKEHNAVWLAFLDGEEALVDWNTNNDNTYGAREMAARLALSGELKRVKAVILADMVGPKDLKVDQDTNSTPWLSDLVWKTASRLGYKSEFSGQKTGIEDDHLPFVQRGIPSVDIIDLIGYQNSGYWHTPQDTMDKISPKSIAVVGHVMLETIGELQKKFH
jgi:glutaminyl-peptide cyclotransferase